MLRKDKFLSEIYGFDWMIFEGNTKNKKDILQTINKNNYKKLDFVIPASDFETANFLMKKGCKLVSSKVYYWNENKNSVFLENKDGIYIATEKDVENLRDICIKNFNLRYSTEKSLNKDLILTLYEKWMYNNVTKRCKEVIVYKENRCVLGFASVIDKQSYDYIEMVGVDKSVQRRGIGKRLIQTILKKYPNKPKECITQIDNKGMQNTLIKNGFKIKNVELIFSKDR